MLNTFKLAALAAFALALSGVASAKDAGRHSRKSHHQSQQHWAKHHGYRGAPIRQDVSAKHDAFAGNNGNR
ncbi:hypothetical protein [Caballeronia temeraria]|uniref:hypothetical protein n=1 Tax=Caballeronia temeraria TaxID=1777137 RepID=UPI0012FE70FE|nr:hypothetical protein [Caballeronia temeraria]